MTILERLRQVFEGPGVSEDARRVFSASKSAGDLIRGLEELWGRNRLDYDDRYDELAKITRLVESQRGELRDGALDSIATDRLMDDLDLRLPQLTFLKNRVRMLKRNMQVQQNLIGKIQEMETMSLRGFNEAEVDLVLERVQEELDAYTRDLKAGESSEPQMPDVSDEAEVVAREERKRRLLGDAPQAGDAAASRKRSTREPESE